MATLFVIRGIDQGIRFELEGPIYQLGRDSSNAIQIHDSEVSRHHAEIRHRENEFVISDLNSSNGTYVNGRRVEQHKLESGDQVQTGSTLMLFTGTLNDSNLDLAQNVKIAPVQDLSDSSRIVKTITQEEGSQILDYRPDAPQNTWLARARSNLQIMYRTALAVSHTLDIDQLLQRIMELIFEWVEADRGCVMLMDPVAKTLLPRVRRTRKGIQADDKIHISKTILDYVIEKNEGVVTSDARLDDRWNPAGSILQMGIREAICVPMQGRYDVVGVIYIDTSTSPQQMIKQGGASKFTEDHLKLMIAIGHQAALAVEDTRYYSAMVQAERLAAVGQTIATLSHHIKNILQGIRGGSYLIEMGLREHDEDVVGKGWKIVEKNQNKISALVMDMLTFSKEREPDLMPGNLNDTIHDVVELMNVRAEEFQVELTWQPCDSMPDLIFDPEGIHRAVLERGDQRHRRRGREAAAGQGRGPHRIRLGENTLARIVVEDNGPGIPADQMDHLFSPFVSSKKSRGTGLGLPVSQKIIREHGGKLLVDSQVGRGARFTFELPAVQPKNENAREGTATMTREELEREVEN